MCNLEFFPFCSRVQFWCHIWTWKEMQSSAKTGLPDGGKFPCTNTPPLSKKYIQWSQSTLDKSIFLPMQFHETLGCVLFILVIWSHARPIKKNTPKLRFLQNPVRTCYYQRHRGTTLGILQYPPRFNLHGVPVISVADRRATHVLEIMDSSFPWHPHWRFMSLLCEVLTLTCNMFLSQGLSWRLWDGVGR